MSGLQGANQAKQKKGVRVLRSWFVAHTKPRAEGHVALVLARKNVNAFLPRLLTRHRHGSRRWSVLEPLFPGYLFVQLNATPEDFAHVRWTPGIKRLLGAREEDAPTPVPDEIVTFLQERSGEQGFIVTPSRLVSGSRVRFKSGLLTFVEGIIERPASRADRVRVLLHLMHASITADVHIDDLELVGTA